MADVTDKLIWVDTETTGLDFEKNVLLEVAIVITDYNFNLIADLPTWVIHQSDVTLDRMDDWCKSVHGHSKLIEASRSSTTSVEQFEHEALTLISGHVEKQKGLMAGNSIGFDRAFLKRYTPSLESYFNYRNIDVSSIRELMKRWCPQIPDPERSSVIHRAKQDVWDSIALLKYYRDNVFPKRII